jgi:RHS repeat-associated protein
LPDHLGSVRQLVGSDSQVDLAQSFDPFGVPFETSGSGESDFGYTGEWWNSEAGLLYLRARYYDPLVGRFVSKDPWQGDSSRPQSLNAWSYVQGNPINRVDPTGFRPRSPEEIGELYEYSCNCGWIDWGHALPGLASTILERLKAKIDWDRINHYYGWTGQRGIRVTSGVGGVLQTPLGNIGLVVPLVNDFAVVKEDEIDASLVPIATGIYIEHSEAFEEVQSQKWYKRSFEAVGGVLGAGAGRSGFSEEDLPSNIIGFWIALQMREGISYEDAKKKVQDICGTVGKAKSLEVYEKEYDNGSGFIEGWKAWEPRLVTLDETHNDSTCDGGLCPAARKWPSEFSRLTSSALSSQRGGAWWWWSLADGDLGLSATSVEGVYGITVTGFPYDW